MWFEKLTGFREENPSQVRQNLEVRGNILKSLVNGKEFLYGNLEIPTLKELRDAAPPIEIYKDKIKVSERVGNVQLFHKERENKGALFQVASQFNLLEMVGPSITPERGVDIYEKDFTQGPACAIACGAGTIYRNYFAQVNGQLGQSASNQIDCLDEIGNVFNNSDEELWLMKNGYALANIDGLAKISRKISQSTPTEYEDIKSKLKIGVQWDTEVTISSDNHKVTQVYCSALPVAYSGIDSVYWAEFAKLILEASYEATFYAALANYEKTGNSNVFLTLVGGGAFGNKKSWIFDAIRKSIYKFSNTPLVVNIVSYGHSNASVTEFIRSSNKY